jgi:hypothetical protein
LPIPKTKGTEGFATLDREAEAENGCGDALVIGMQDYLDVEQNECEEDAITKAIYPIASPFDNGAHYIEHLLAKSPLIDLVAATVEWGVNESRC